MISRRLSPYAFLLIALLLGSLATVLQLSVQHQLLEAPEKQMAEEISGRVWKAEKRAQLELARVASILPSDSSLFSSSLSKSSLPIFIYRRGELIFWSDHTLRPEIDLRVLRHEVQTTESRYGRFLTIKHVASSEYTLVAVVPLEIRYSISNQYLRSGLNPLFFEEHSATIQLERSKNSVPIVDTGGHYLFSVKVLEPSQWLHTGKITSTLFALAIVAALLFVISFRKWLILREKHSQALVCGVAVLLLLRFLMLIMEFPNSIYELSLFSPKIYAASWWSPSLGDLWLNVLTLLVIAYWIFQYSKYIRFKGVLPKLSQNQLLISKIGLGVLLALVIIGWYKAFRSLVINTQETLDVTQSISFDWDKILLYGSIIFYTLVVSWCIRALMIWGQFLRTQSNNVWAIWIACLSCLIGWGYLVDAPNGQWIVLASGLVLLLWEEIPALLSKRKGVYVSIFILNIMSASLGASALYDAYAAQLRSDKQRIASQLLKDRDEITEYLLAQAAKDISADGILQQQLRLPWFNISFFENKIRMHHLQDISDNYAVVVRLFDINGESLFPQDEIASLQQYIRQKIRRARSTHQPGQLLLSSGAEPGHFTYFQEARIPLNGNFWALVVIELTPKITTPNSVLPELLIERKSISPEVLPNSSYGIWRGNRWLKTSGYFEYGQSFKPRLFENPQLYSQGITLEKYHHLGSLSTDGTIAVVSTPSYGFRSWLSNFSLFFLLHTLVVFALLGIVVLYRGKLVQAFSPNFSTKIQLFLNLGMLVPLVLVSLTIGSLVTDSYKEDLVRGYTEQGDIVRQTLLTGSIGPHILKAQPDSLLRRVSRLASIVQAEVNVYDANGRLRVASQPALFDAGVLSNRLNPEAFRELNEQGLNRVLLNEKAGTLPYSTLYLPLKLSPTHKPEGYLGIPFFDSEKELDTKLIELITTILDIFTVLFLIFVLISYFATRALTVPLQLLTERLKKTTLTGRNEKLVYESADEIGLLVSEYNQMLQKLEESKQELALKEKEAAWKEMARQVAHEIKNPLTPMKLSLQYLRKAMQEGRNLEGLIEKISNTMITQIDVLSDIATSFSNFTAMPDLKLEELELNALVRQAADLHLNPQLHQVNLEIPEKPIYVKADENQLIRIFNNLLLNAIQAVPSSRKPEITVQVQETAPAWVLVEVQDNGAGIPEDVQPKIFIPNFSTKYTGSGIGLAVVKKGVEAIGGSIWFETTEDVGTTFFLKLPVVNS